MPVSPAHGRQEWNNANAIKWTVSCLLLALLAGAVYYYKERMLFIDAPHILWRIMNEQAIQVADFRYGSFITQSFPVVAMWLHLPLRGVMALYSASFYIFYATVGLLLLFRFREYALTTLFALYLTLFVSATYFWPNNEIHQGVAWLLLAFMVNKWAAMRKAPLAVAFPLFVASLFLAIWTHPLVMVVAVFLWFFWIIEGDQWPYSRLQTIVYTAALLMLAYLKYNQGKTTGYDSTKIEVVNAFNLAHIKTIISSPQFKYLAKGVIANYWLVPLLFIWGSISLLKAKKYVLLAYSIAYATGYVCLLCITFWDVTANRFYLESEYMPLTIICCASFVYYTLPTLRSGATVALLALLFLVRVAYIVSAVAPFTGRIAILAAINNKMSEKKLTKVIINPTNATVDEALIMNWGGAVESIFISGLNGDPIQRTFLFNNNNQFTYFLTSGNDTLIGCWEKRPSSRINHRYFVIDTTVPYTTIGYDELMK